MGEIYEMTRGKGQMVEEGKRDATREELLKPNQGSQVNFDWHQVQYNWAHSVRAFSSKRISLFTLRYVVTEISYHI